jgi:hypothetical protein
MKEPKIKEVVHRKLKRHKADGLAWLDEGIIEIDERLKGQDHLETALHEGLHILNPKMIEPKIIHQSRALKDMLWKLGYRRVEL